jgi:hypothetical protein
VLDLADHGSSDHPFSRKNEDYYWQPQPPEEAWPQHDAFSDGSQHEACLTGEQQLEASPADCDEPTRLCSCADGAASPDRSMTVLSMRILRFQRKSMSIMPTLDLLSVRGPVLRASY